MSGANAAGRKSFSKNSLDKLARDEDGTGLMSNGISLCRRFSLRMRSSCALAMARRGPVRIQMRPSYLTGGISEGSTVTTAISAPLRWRFSTFKTGIGNILPSLRMSASCKSRSSVIGKPEGVPSSLAPIKRMPGSLWLGKSLANSQTACRAFSRTLPPLNDSLRSTQSDSRSLRRASRSASEICFIMARVYEAPCRGAMAIATSGGESSCTCPTGTARA